jgi:replicative DNA helicase
LVIVDYIGITRPTHPRMERYEHLTEVSGELKNMAKELNVPVLALSQLNRSLARENRRPRVDDLRESGALEQDADLILLLSANVEADDLPDVWRDKITDANQLENVVLCDVAKNREGGTGHAFLQFNRQFTLYTDLALVK